MKLLHLGRSAALKQKRLAELRATRAAGDDALHEALEQALAQGSLALAGIPPDPGAIAQLRAARNAVAPDAPFAVAALLAWHRAATGSGGTLRQKPRAREGGPPPAPVEFLEARLESLAH